MARQSARSNDGSTWLRNRVIAKPWELRSSTSSGALARRRTQSTTRVLARHVGLAARKSEIEVLPGPSHWEVEADTVRVAADSFPEIDLE